MTVRTPREMTDSGSPRITKLAARLYRALLTVLPRDFRSAYAQPMYETFSDRLHDERYRSSAVLVLLLRAFADLVATTAVEWAAALARRNHPHLPATPRASMLYFVADDLRFALRLLRKHKTFTLFATLVLSLGIGSVSTIFSVANAIVLRPLPGVDAPDGLRWISRADTKGRGSLSASYPYFETLASSTRTMESVAAWTMVSLTVSTGDAGVSLLGNMVSPSYFRTLGVRPYLGRFFTEDETRAEGASPLAVISHGYWTTALGSDSLAIGRNISINGRPYTIVGVAPPRFSSLFPILRTDVWVPLAMFPHLRPGRGSLQSANTAFLELFGRLKPGQSEEAARAELSAATARFVESGAEQAYLGSMRSVRLAPLTGLPPDAGKPVVAFFTILLVVAGAVLMIASVNVASMLLARSTTRRREIAVRLAIGAGPHRILAQLLTETLVLFTIGGGVGIVVAIFGTRLATRIELPVDMPMQIDVAPDGRVIAFTVVVALVTGLVFGLAPALQSLRLDINHTLRDGGAGAGRRRSRLRNSLVIGQVAMSLLLLTAAGLFARSLQKGRAVDMGFSVDGVSTAAFDVGTAGYDETRTRLFYEQLTDRLRRQPGIDAVGIARLLPLAGNTAGRTISIPEALDAGRDQDNQTISFNQVDGGYFEAVQLPLAQGRAFTSADDDGAPHVVVVNQAFVRQHFATRSALGRIVKLDSISATIVGVVRDSKFSSLSETAQPFLYLPQRQWHSSATNVLVRGTLPSSQVAALIRSEARALDSRLPVPVVTTLRQATAISLLPQRAAAATTAILGAIGLVLATVGLYGVIAFSAAQRTHEMGVRLALGARPRDVRGLVVSEGMRLVVVGVAVGLVLAIVGARALMPFLFGLDPVDVQTFAGSTVVMLAATWLASYLPARRAAAMDPMASLRRE